MILLDNITSFTDKFEGIEMWIWVIIVAAIWVLLLVIVLFINNKFFVKKGIYTKFIRVELKRLGVKKPSKYKWFDYILINLLHELDQTIVDKRNKGRVLKMNYNTEENREKMVAIIGKYFVLNQKEAEAK